MKLSFVKIPVNVAIENIATEDLLTGLFRGFNFSMYEMEAVAELVKRGKQKELIAVYDLTSRKFARTCIRKAGLVTER